MIIYYTARCSVYSSVWGWNLEAILIVRTCWNDVCTNILLRGNMRNRLYIQPVFYFVRLSSNPRVLKELPAGRRSATSLHTGLKLCFYKFKLRHCQKAAAFSHAEPNKIVQRNNCGFLRNILSHSSFIIPCKSWYVEESAIGMYE